MLEHEKHMRRKEQQRQCAKNCLKNPLTMLLGHSAWGGREIECRVEQGKKGNLGVFRIFLTCSYFFFSYPIIDTKLISKVEFVLPVVLFPCACLDPWAFCNIFPPCIVNRRGMIELGGHLATSWGQSSTQHEDVNTYCPLKRKEESHEGSETGRCKGSNVESFVNLKDCVFMSCFYPKKIEEIMLNIDGFIQLPFGRNEKGISQITQNRKFLSVLYAEEIWVVRRLASQLNFGIIFTTSCWNYIWNWVVRKKKEKQKVGVGIERWKLQHVRPINSTKEACLLTNGTSNRVSDQGT